MEELALSLAYASTPLRSKVLLCLVLPTLAGPLPAGIVLGRHPQCSSEHVDRMKAMLCCAVQLCCAQRRHSIKHASISLSSTYL